MRKKIEEPVKIKTVNQKLPVAVASDSMWLEAQGGPRGVEKAKMLN